MVPYALAALHVSGERFTAFGGFSKSTMTPTRFRTTAGAGIASEWCGGAGEHPVSSKIQVGARLWELPREAQLNVEDHMGTQLQRVLETALCVLCIRGPQRIQ